MAEIAGIDTSGVASVGLNIIVLIVSVVVVGAIAFAIFWVWKKKKQYGQYKFVIWEVAGKGLRETYDKGGIFSDPKTKNKLLFMKKTGVGMSPDHIPYIQAGKDKVVYVIREGLRNFRFISPQVSANPGLHFDVGDEDVNWAINDFERYKKMLATNQLLQYMPFILLAFVSLIILIIFIYFFKDFSVLKDVAVELREAATMVAQARAGTVVVQ